MKKLICLGFGLLFFTQTANAIDIGVGVKAGTVGAGVDLSVALTKTINLRVALTNVDIEDQDETVTIGDDVNEGELDASLDFDYGANALLVDWYVFNGTFHLTAGMMKNNGKMSFSGILQDDVVLDGITVNLNDFDGNEISGDVSLADSYQPYLGIGWGRKAGSSGGISISFEVGVALLDPDASLDATLAAGSGLNQAELEQSIRAAEDDVNADLDELEAWPIISLGVNYAF
jgi:hypothetical protein